MEKLTATKECPNKEDDLDSLLDSALDDFQKPLSSPVSSKRVSDQQPAAGTSTADSAKTKDEPNKDSACNQWAADYKSFQDVMQSLLNADPEAFGDLGLSGENGEDIASSLSETLKAITECTQSIPEPSPEELAQLLNSMGVDDKGNIGNEDQIPDVMPLMQNVMQSLLSKELLYPALKDFVNKYPDWLASKRETLDKNEYDKYSTQYNLMKEVCEEFEQNEDNTEEEKTRSFQKILMLMQKMKDCGDPPKELVGDVSPELAALDLKQNALPGMSEQCVIM